MNQFLVSLEIYNEWIPLYNQNPFNPNYRTQIPTWVFTKFIIPFLFKWKLSGFPDCNYSWDNQNANGSSTKPYSRLYTKFSINDIEKGAFLENLDVKVIMGNMGKDYGFIGCTKMEEGTILMFGFVQFLFHLYGNGKLIVPFPFLYWNEAERNSSTMETKRNGNKNFWIFTSNLASPLGS